MEAKPMIGASQILPEIADMGRGSTLGMHGTFCYTFSWQRVQEE
jgi:hypothetical protein